MDDGTNLKTPSADAPASAGPGRFPFGIGLADPLVPSGDEWWKAWSDEEVEAWIRGEF